jgi:hypothetical protein
MQLWNLGRQRCVCACVVRVYCVCVYCVCVFVSVYSSLAERSRVLECVLVFALVRSAVFCVCWVFLPLIPRLSVCVFFCVYCVLCVLGVSLSEFL